MSPLRSRSGGNVTVVALIRSARPALKSSGRGRLLVAMTRTSTEWLPLSPTGRTSPVARTRSSSSCVSAGNAPISSSSRVPPSASTILPILAAKAPGKAPFSWPNNSLSMMLAGTALQSTVSSGPRARRLAAWIARAIVSLPVPGSPTIRIGRRLRAALAAIASEDRNSGEAPTICSSSSSGASFSDTGASSPEPRRRSALAASASSSRSGATGRTRKSVAPARIASTATDTVSPWLRTITGRSVALLAQRRDQLGPALARPRRRSGPPGLRGHAGPGAGRRRVSESAAPTALQPARAAIAEIKRRSSASASSSNSERTALRPSSAP